MIFTDNRPGRPYAKDPAVVFFGGRALMYYSLGPSDEAGGMTGWSIGIAESRDLDQWQIVGRIESAGGVEAKGFCAPGAIVMDGKVHLFYQTYGNGKDDALCHATSVDGLTFTRNPANPILKPTGAWNAGRAIDADVVLWRGKLWCFWATRDPLMKIQQIGAHTADPTSDFAPSRWTQVNQDGPLLKPELAWEGECIEASAVCVHDDRLFMWYGGSYNASPQQIGCAVSDDGRTWKRLGDGPWLPCGTPGSWNQHESGHPFVYTHVDGTTHLFYQGTGDKGRTWWLTRRPVRWVNGLPVPG